MKKSAVLVCSILLASCSQQNSCKSQSSDGAAQPCPAPSPSVTPTSSPVSGNPIPADYDIFAEVARPVADAVDSQYSSFRELGRERAADSAYPVDSCVSALSGHNTFADRVAFAVDLGMSDIRAELTYVSDIFGLPEQLASMRLTSLWRHPLCKLSSASLQESYRGRNVPSEKVIQLLNQFSSSVNDLRTKALGGDSSARKDLHKTWSKFMMCLSYVESLTTADDAKSQTVARNLGVRKPAGVEYYLDGLQSDPDSELNIGLYQFSPVAGGNIQSCLREWNTKFPACSVGTQGDQSAMINLIGGAEQTFNAFCGVMKVVDMFAVQVNTNLPASTHIDNRNGQGNLLAPENRCVTPFFGSGSYNHFGPFQNSVGTNLNELMSCALAD